MLISIITPSYNQAAFLEETMLSVFRQDYADIEYIVIDGGSTDGSDKIIKRHERKLAYWVSERDQGQTDALMKGFARAKGEVLAWLCSDDCLAPSAARIAAQYLAADPSLGLVYGDRLHIDAKGNVIGINRGPSFYEKMLQRNITIPQETAFFRRSVFEQAGKLNLEHEFAMDFALWCALQKITKFKHVPAFLGSYREHSAAKSVAQYNGDGASKRDHEQVFQKHFGRGLPGKWRTRWYHLQHKSRFFVESLGRPYREERATIRRLMEQG
jgi:glycosyltransferase involved in cell wall biosynthesis